MRSSTPRTAAAPTLTEIELLRALGDAKPLGSTATDVLGRMRREQLIRTVHGGPQRGALVDGRAGRPAVPASRHRGARDAWAVRDADALLDLIYAEHRPGGSGAPARRCRRSGGSTPNELDALVAQLQTRTGCSRRTVNERAGWLELTWSGVRAAPARALGRGCGSEAPLPLGWAAATAAPYQRRLPIRIGGEDRRHPDRWPDEPATGATARRRRGCSARARRSCGRRCAVTAPPSGRCRNCDSHWLVYLQAYGRDDRPAYRDPAEATHNRPHWRPTWKP